LNVTQSIGETYRLHFLRRKSKPRNQQEADGKGALVSLLAYSHTLKMEEKFFS
jgi:hypothetical protein